VPNCGPAADLPPSWLMKSSSLGKMTLRPYFASLLSKTWAIACGVLPDVFGSLGLGSGAVQTSVGIPASGLGMTMKLLWGLARSGTGRQKT
jgi:hypothetical protein